MFLEDLLARPLSPDKQTGGLVDRTGRNWMVFDIDGTREAARQRALPQTDDLPPAFRRFDDVCAPGYRGRKRGETVRTRTTVSQAHSYQWPGSFGNQGNGRYREELRKGISAIGRYLAAHHLSQERTLIRLDGQYGNGAVLSDVAGFAFVTRGKDYRLLDHPLLQARLHLPPIRCNNVPRVRWSAASTIAPQSRWGLRERSIAWSWPRIPPERKRVRLESPEKAWSTNCSSQTCPNRRLLPAMSLSCTCIVALLSLPFPMKTRR
ncbi:hypothetical protein [Dictyobacter formicarum]|uniref:hypothetical protein n=1 Tax=Dictyobacter formicarum TaxID=2778368 RepID=UPI001F3CB3A8|nr:hypothetical protein [Dictyobacter formicarum]